MQVTNHASISRVGAETVSAVPEFAEIFGSENGRVKLTRGDRQTLFHEVQRHIKSTPHFLDVLPGLWRGGYYGAKKTIFFYDHVLPSGKVCPLVIKDRGGNLTKENDPVEVRKIIGGVVRELSRDALGKKSKNLPYSLSMPLLYGVVSDHLIVMERVRGCTPAQLRSRLPVESPLLQSLEQALRSYQADLVPGPISLDSNNPMHDRFNLSGQVKDLIIAGHTNRGEPGAGKWIFFLPYDLQ